MTPRLLNTDMSTPSPSALYMNMQWSICLIMIKLNSTSWIGAGLNLLVKRLTDGHERMRGQTVTRHADAVDSVHAHLIRHSFNHPLGFIGCFRVRVKVQPHPPVALRLLPLQHIAWELKQKQMMLLHYILIHILSIQYTFSCFLLFFSFFFFFTNDWLPSIKQRRIPLDDAGLLSHADDSDSHGRIRHVWGKSISYQIFVATWPDSTALIVCVVNSAQVYTPMIMTTDCSLSYRQLSRWYLQCPRLQGFEPPQSRLPRPASQPPRWWRHSVLWWFQRGPDRLPLWRPTQREPEQIVAWVECLLVLSLETDCLVALQM